VLSTSSSTNYVAATDHEGQVHRAPPNKQLLLTRVICKGAGPLAYSSRPLLADGPRSRIARR
jgi:hypothetical protein